MFAVPQHKRRLLSGAAFLLLALVPVAFSQTQEQGEQSHRAKELMAQGLYGEAIPIYRTLVNQLPGNAGLLLNLAMAEAMGGQPQSAISHCQTILKTNAQNIPALTMLSMSHLQLNQPAEAVAPLSKLVSLSPESVDARGMLAGAEMTLRHFESAAQQYAKLTGLTPDDPKAWYGLGKANEALADWKFQQLTKAAPQSPYVAVLIAETRVQRRQYRSAFFFYREAEKQMPQLAGIHSGLEAVYERTGHSDWASSEKKKEASLTANCQTSKTAACEFAQGRYASLTKTANTTPASLFWATRAYNQLALDAFRRLGKLPESTELHALKAQMLHDHNQDLEAVKEWQAALSIAPEDARPQLQMQLATALFLGGDYAKAIPAIEELLKQDRNSADLNFMLGESELRTQQAGTAVPYLETAVAQNPAMLPAHAALGLALVSLNKASEAVPHLEKAAELDDDGSLHYSLARAYMSLGDKQKAQTNMQTYRGIQQRNAEVNGQLAKEAEITAPSS